MRPLAYLQASAQIQSPGLVLQVRGTRVPVPIPCSPAHPLGSTKPLPAAPVAAHPWVPAGGGRSRDILEGAPEMSLLCSGFAKTSRRSHGAAGCRASSCTFSPQLSREQLGIFPAASPCAIWALFKAGRPVLGHSTWPILALNSLRRCSLAIET